MKTKHISPLALLTAMLLCVMSLTSCGDDYYYDDPYWGNILTEFQGWELYSVNGRVVPEADVTEFRFFTDGTGSYGRYNSGLQWYENPMTWDVDYAGNGAEYLSVWVTGAYDQPWEYLMRIYSGSNPRLELNDLDTGDRLIFIPY